MLVKGTPGGKVVPFENTALQILINSHTPTPRRIYSSVNWVNIVSDNGLSPIRYQAII